MNELAEKYLMRWYDFAQLPVVGFFKQASNDDVWESHVSDFQRWVVDAFDIKIAVVQTKYKIVVSVFVFNSHVGEMMWQDFWKFDLHEMSKATSLFKKMKAKCEEIVDMFKETESPTNLIHAYLRNELRNMNRDNLPQTNIPSINYSLRLDYVKDWRSSIYGTRYPNRETTGF